MIWKAFSTGFARMKKQGPDKIEENDEKDKYEQFLKYDEG